MPISVTLFPSLGSCCVAMFQERPHNEGVSVPLASKLAAFVHSKNSTGDIVPPTPEGTEQETASFLSTLKRESTTYHVVGYIENR